ncbi:uncharacterized protein FOMMEDRAFT_170177 [Fomitiporia mediterranea MF3/22]|uniref:uncharacterized protein n=1 Tax=Fomitiporia mediterranea (strain MF3/22) TaxID=694068 RepID=UPI00044084B8|nr:uncharacterized protein FOMMEDRAFT_170177 [Fomitiporia mediterranea MF3/22]EJD00180.1 hypothetical protein FOMMEDRAFT_170177 [Fomitiporia mediterranea MF3/22]
MSSSELALATKLVKSAKIPLYTSPTALTWVLLDYFDTLPDEVRYMWPGAQGLGKMLFYWIRYYTILVTVFDVAQIHSFSKFRPSLTTCVAMDSVIRIVGAISLWSVEIIMQLRIYALYNCSKRVAAFNIFLFLMSIGGFFWILVHNAQGRAAVIHQAKALPIPGCPVVHTGIEWAQWIPATVFEGVLFVFALLKSLHTIFAKFRGGVNMMHTNGMLFTIIVNDNLLYFFGISGLLVLNNLMVVGATKIPWFSYSPFHAAMGIMTSRLLMHLHKAVVHGRVVMSGVNPSRTNNATTMNTYPMQMMSTNGTMSWNVDRNASLGSSTLIASEDRYLGRYTDA